MFARDVHEYHSDNDKPAGYARNPYIELVVDHVHYRRSHVAACDKRNNVTDDAYAADRKQDEYAPADHKFYRMCEFILHCRLLITGRR